MRRVTDQALSRPELRELAADMEKLRARTMARVGAEDARYIRSVVAAVRYMEAAGRLVLFFGIFPPAWIVGTLLLAASKILENMEVAHNVMHGQYDWMNDPTLRGHEYEWDTVATSDNWRYSHNFRHHIHSNVRGLDDDVGALRLFPDQQWRPVHLLQPVAALVSAFFSQWAVAAQNSGLGEWLRGRIPFAELRASISPAVRKARGRLLKDYLIFPLLAGPFFLPVLLGNLTANGLRNLWSWMVILCNHCTADVTIYSQEEVNEEPPEHWYYRQIRGASNFSGNRLLAIMSGHLGYHIEHHLFPDMPAYRYPEIAPEVQRICRRHGVHYNTGSFPHQFGQAIWRIVRYSFPGPDSINNGRAATDISTRP